MQKKRVSILLTFSLLLGIGFISSCANNFKRNFQEDTLDRIRRTGELQACYIVFPPSIIRDPKTGKLSGQDYETLTLIAQSMNAKVNWIETGYNNSIPDVQSGRCDVIPEPVFANIPRAASVAFTTPYIYFGEGAIIRKNDPRFKNVTNPMEFDKPNITVVVAAGESGDIWVKEHFTKAKIKRMETSGSDPSSFMLEVSSKRADVCITDAVGAALYASRHPEVMDTFHGRQFSLTPTGWVVRQDDVKWRHFLETALQFLDTQGTIEKLEKKYHAPWMHLVKQYTLQ